MDKYSVPRKERKTLTNLFDIFTLDGTSGINNEIDLTENNLLVRTAEVDKNGGYSKREQSCPRCGKFEIIQTKNNNLCGVCDYIVSREYDRNLTSLEYKYGFKR